MKKEFSITLISLLLIVIAGLVTHIIDSKDIKTTNKELLASDKIMHVTKTRTKDEIIYEVIDNSKDLTYSWTFPNNEEMTKSIKENMEIDLDLRLQLLTNIKNKNIDNLVSNEDKLIISFNHHGELPTKAKIKLNVSEKYDDGQKLYLYYYNEEQEQIEYIKDGIIVKNGEIEFEITHCSKYLLTASIVQDAVNNPKNINIIIIVMVVVIIVLIGATLFQNKK